MCSKSFRIFPILYMKLFYCQRANYMHDYSITTNSTHQFSISRLDEFLVIYIYISIFNWTIPQLNIHIYVQKCPSKLFELHKFWLPIDRISDWTCFALLNFPKRVDFPTFQIRRENVLNWKGFRLLGFSIAHVPNYSAFWLYELPPSADSALLDSLIAPVLDWQDPRWYKLPRIQVLSHMNSRLTKFGIRQELWIERALCSNCVFV